MKEKISVIVPVYNVEKYIEECISSIMRQTFDNLEIILVDDGSTDNSGKICDELAKKDLRINVIHQSNQGLSAARNTGLKHAMGDYISFIDSDDYIHIDMLNKLYEAIINSDSDLAICNYKYVYMQDFVGKHVDYQSPMHNEILTREEAIGKLFEATPWFYITATNKLYKRKIWKNMCFPEGIFMKMKQSYIVCL